MVTTVLGITGLWIAILADTGATVLVTLNALRLFRFDPSRHDSGSSRAGGQEAKGSEVPQAAE